jgi:spermidine/putrescine transport system permease protein
MPRADVPSPLTRRGGGLALLAPAWVVLGGFFLLPLGLVFVISFARGDGSGGFEPVGDLWHHLRSGAFLDNYARTLRPRYLGIFWRSLWTAVLTTAFCLLIGYPVAYYVAVVAPRRLKALLLMLVVLPFWTSFLIRTYAWQVILRDEGLLNGLFLAAGLTDSPVQLLDTQLAVMIGLVYGELPFMVLPLYASLEKLDRSLLEAAADLGAGGWSAFRRVTLPLSTPGLVAGTVLVFIPSVGQYIVSDLLGGAKGTLVGNLVHGQFVGSGGVGDKPFGAALAFELTALVLALLAAYAIYARRRGGEVVL